jgi:hypothetical protein
VWERAVRDMSPDVNTRVAVFVHGTFSVRCLEPINPFFSKGRGGKANVNVAGRISTERGLERMGHVPSFVFWLTAAA